MGPVWIRFLWDAAAIGYWNGQNSNFIKPSFTCPKPPSAHIFHKTPWTSSSRGGLPPSSWLAPAWCSLRGRKGLQGEKSSAMCCWGTVAARDCEVQRSPAATFTQKKKKKHNITTQRPHKALKSTSSPPPTSHNFKCFFFSYPTLITSDMMLSKRQE